MSGARSPLYTRRDDPDAAWRLGRQLHRASALDTRVVVNLTDPDDGIRRWRIDDESVTELRPLAKWRQLALIAEDDLLFRRAFIIRSADYVLIKDPKSHYVIKVCLMEDGLNRVDTIATFSGSTRDLGLNQPEKFTGVADLERAVTKGNSVWLCIERHGRPAPLVGTAVQLTFGPKGV